MTAKTECPCCDGTGLLQDLNDLPIETYVDCIHCHGTGKVAREEARTIQSGIDGLRAAMFDADNNLFGDGW